MSAQALRLAFALISGVWLTGAQAAEQTYPFLGAWIRSDRVCTPSSTRERIYTPHEVTSSRGRCTIRKISAGSNSTFELFERCERPNERPSRISEIIRMTGADAMELTRQSARLKLSRKIRFTRCSVPAVSKPVK